MRAAIERWTARRDKRGASAVEYGLLIAAIAALIVVTVFFLGGMVRQTLFEDTCQVIHDNTPDLSSSCS